MTPYPLLPWRKEVASTAKGVRSLIGSKYAPVFNTVDVKVREKSSAQNIGAGRVVDLIG